MSYQIGQRIRATASFRNTAGALADPTSVTCRLRAPNGTVTTETASHQGTGMYQVERVVDQAGLWRIKFVGTGTIETMVQSSFYVAPDEVG